MQAMLNRRGWLAGGALLAVIATFVYFGWRPIPGAAGARSPYRMGAAQLEEAAHALGFHWHAQTGESTPVVIDFGGGAPDAPVAGLDQWLAANSGEVSPAAVDAPVLGSKKAMVLRVYFKDYANTSRFSQAQVQNLITSMDDLWQKTSYGKINVVSVVSDLYQLPKNRSEYIDDSPPCEPDPAIRPLGDLSCGDKFLKVLNDAIDNAPAGLDWTNVDTVFVLMAETSNTQFHRGQADKCTLKMGPGGATKYVGCVIMSENPTETTTELYGRMGHEFGHAFQQAGPAHPSNYNNEFELMDSNYPGQTGVFEKLDSMAFPGWLPPSKYAEVTNAEGGDTVCLWAMEYDPAGKPNLQAVKVSITGSLYYMLSVRRKILGDDLNADFNGIPDEGVLIERVSEGSDPWVQVKGKGGNRNVLWKAGDTFDSGADGIVVVITQQPDVDNYCLTIRYNKNANQPDVMIYPWTSPPGNTWETTDIWVDSPVNGYGTFRYGTWASLAGDIVPRGNGDDPAVGLVNRLYARVRNVGNQTATNVKVSFEVTDPPGLGIAGASGWASLGSVDSTSFPGLASIAPGTYVDVYVEWTPNIALTPEQIAAGVFAFHTCVRVKIDPVPGELVLGNQNGDREQENIGYFEATSSGDPTYTNFIRLHNDDLVNRKYFNLSFKDEIPASWLVDVNGGNFGVDLAPGEVRDIPITIKPVGAAVVGSIFGVDVQASSLKILTSDLDARDKHQEANILGGVRVEARVLQKPEIRCTARDFTEIGVEGTLTNLGDFYDSRVPPVVLAVAYAGDGSVIPLPQQGLATVLKDGTFQTYVYSSSPAIKFVRCLFAGTDKLASAATPLIPVIGSQDPTPTNTPVPPQAACRELFSPREIPSPAKITFDDLPDAAVIGNHYEPGFGVKFEDTSVTRAIIYADRASDPTKALSKPNVAANNAVSPNTSDGVPLTFHFTARKSHVGMFMGNGETAGLTGVLSAYDAAGNLICRVSNRPVPESYTEFIGLYDPSGQIATVTLDYGKTLLSESIDDLYFTYNPAPVTPVVTPSPTPTFTPTPTPIAVAPIVAMPYFPANVALIPSVLQPDLSIFGIEFTQGIQCFDTSQGLTTCADNSLPLVNKKDATARIYLRNQSLLSSSLSGVPVRLHIFANGVEYIANATGKATTSINRGVRDAAEIYFNVNFNNDIAVSFYAEVDPANTISESNEGNNRYPASGTISLTFRKRDTLKIVGQRLRYHPSGYAGTQNAGGWAVNGGAADYMEQLMPIRNNGIDYSIRSGYLDWTSSLTPCSSTTGGDNQHALIQQLNSLWILQNALSWMFGSDFLGADHVYGWVPNAGYPCGHADMPVYPHAGGLGVVGIGTDAPGTTTDTPGAGSYIMVHELFHDYDLKHTNTADACGSNDSSSAFPYGSSSIQEFGFNPLTGKIYNPSNTHDVLSYCPSGGSREGWISPYTWNYMSGKIDLAAAADAAGADGTLVRLGAENMQVTGASQSLVVDLTIFNPATSPAKAGTLNAMHKVDGGIAYPLPGTGYAVQLRNGATVLSSEEFGVSFESEYDGHGEVGHDTPPFPSADSPQADLSLIIPWVDGATSIALVQGSTVLDSRAVSAHAPVVTITNPASPATWPAGTQQTLTWTGSDADGGTLSYSVLYSYNDGATWDLVASDLTTTSYVVDVNAFAGGPTARFRVVATDGVNIGIGESAPVSIPNQAPYAVIVNPENGGAYSPGNLVIFSGSGVDMEDGRIPDGQLAWSSNRQGALGVGPSLPVNTLQPGQHTITLTATDANGQSGTATINVFIGERLYLPGIAR
ncbi:MAG: hypothetical protein H6640_19585 [Caldilineaceae bacterium]|nr:hypothetical protein [Caldilineaceae bacterium]